MTQEVEAFMCSTDWEDEVGKASGGISIYVSVADIRRHRPCVAKGCCAIVKVRVRFVAEVVSP